MLLVSTPTPITVSRGAVVRKPAAGASRPERSGPIYAVLMERSRQLEPARKRFGGTLQTFDKLFRKETA